MSSSFTARFPSIQISAETKTSSSATAQVPSSPIHPADEALLSMVSAGEQHALGLLFRRYARLIRAVGQRLLRDGAEADDLVQEVFLYIHRRSELFDRTKGSARSWICSGRLHSGVRTQKATEIPRALRVRNHRQGRLKASYRAPKAHTTTIPLKDCSAEMDGRVSGIL